MTAIVYTSNTGSAEQYAKMLAQELNLPYYSMNQAEKALPKQSEIIYFGWTMAGTVKGLKKAAKMYNISAICAVGMGGTGTQTAELRKQNAIAQITPLFTLQGDFDMEKLRGIYRFIMKFMIKAIGGKLAQKSDRTPEENDMLDMVLHNGKRVNEKNLKSVTDWYRGNH